MTYPRKTLCELSVEELDIELIARGAQIVSKKQYEFRDRVGTPQRQAVMEGVQEHYGSIAPLSPDKTLNHLSAWDLARKLMHETRKRNNERGIWGDDSRRDYFDISDKQIKKNAHSAAAICLKNSLIDTKEGFSTLKVKNFGKAFNLCSCEPFYDQPIAAGRFCTGFLVKEDIIATAAHCVKKREATDLRFVFGYKMLNSSTVGIEIPKQDIYNGEKIIHRCYNRSTGSDWALVKLNRSVVGQPLAKLSKKEISPNQRVYIIGYPVGLPLKYSPGASVSDITEACFSADLNVYCGSSGSPVFDSKTHDVIGIVVRGDNRDFRLVENCWMSVIYSRNDKSPKEPQCTKVSEFIDIADKL
jgi:hypothetical protein